MSHLKDLRDRAVKYVEQGGSIKDACKLFEVSRPSFLRWRAKKIILVALQQRRE